jgi:hypothetical protein
MEEQIYHACRVAFNCGTDGVPWNLVCNALRQGLGYNDLITYALTEKDFAAYPELRELVDKLKSARRWIT